MESKLYEQSLSLFNKGEYEEVLKIFRHTTVVLSEKETILLRESRKQVTEQYLFLIKDYIQEKEYIKAEELQKKYNAEYGFDERIMDIIIPQNIQTKFLQVDDNSNKTDVRLSKTSNIGVIISSIIVLFIIFIFWQYNKNKPMQQAVIENSNDVIQQDNSPQPNSQKTKDVPNQFEYIKDKRGSFEVDIEWPLSLTGIDDISKIQQVIIEQAFNNDSNNLQSCIENFFKEGEEEKSLGEDKREGKIVVKFQQRLNDLYIFKIHIYANLGGGTGSSIIYRDNYIYFSNNIGKLSINDMFTDYSKTLFLVNEHISLDEYACKAEELPDNIILSASGITFIFPKYSIGYGYQGEVKIALTYDELNNVLSEVFKQAIGR